MKVKDMLYIVIINWNGWQDTIECLESIYRSSYKNYQVIVVDNGSTDSSIEYIQTWANGDLCVWCSNYENRQFSYPPIPKKLPYYTYNSADVEVGNKIIDNKVYDQLCTGSVYPLILIKSQTNLGFGSGNNIALRYLMLRNDFKYVWLLNNDTVITTQSMSQMVDTAQKYPGIIGSVLRYYSDTCKVQAYGGGYITALTGRVVTENNNKSGHLNFINGASFMLDKNTLDIVGFFDEKIFMYFEEIDYCIRAANKKISCSCSDASVFHKVGGSIILGSYFSWFNAYKNKFYSLKKNYGLGLWSVIHVGSLILNMITPSVNANKKKASKDALFEIITRR